MWWQQWLALQAWLLPQHSAEAHAEQQLLDDASVTFVHHRRQRGSSGDPTTTVAAAPAAAEAARPQSGPVTQSAGPSAAPATQQPGTQQALAGAAPARQVSAEEASVQEAQHFFDAAELYTAVKPSGREPELQQDLPQLNPVLRSYQRRAAAWMVAREKGQRVGILTHLSTCPISKVRANIQGSTLACWQLSSCLQQLPLSNLIKPGPRLYRRIISGALHHCTSLLLASLSCFGRLTAAIPSCRLQLCVLVSSLRVCRGRPQACIPSGGRCSA